MKPQQFAALAAAALASLVLAITAYTAAAPWQAAVSQGKLFPGLAGDAKRVKRLEISQGASKLELELVRKPKTGGGEEDVWTMKGRDGYPANNEKVRALLTGLTTAEMVEPKTRKVEHYTTLEVEDPALATANSHLLKLLDESGGVLADLVVGKKSSDAFGAARAGTFVRKPGDAQTWLVDAAIEAPGNVTDWVKPRIWETQVGKIKSISLETAGEEPVPIAYELSSKRHKVTQVPKGMRIKYANAGDDIAEALTQIDLDDVRKAIPLAAGEPVSKATVEIDGGLKLILSSRKSDGGDWLTLVATGDGDNKKFADELTAAVKDWEFKLPFGKAGEIWKKRADIFEDDTQDTVSGPGASPKAGEAEKPKEGEKK